MSDGHVALEKGSVGVSS